MTNKKFVLELIKVIAPIISVFFAYHLGRISLSKNEKQELCQKQFELFYLPFVQTYTRNMMWELTFTELSREIKDKFVNLLMNSFHFSSFPIQAIIPDFYVTFSELERLNKNPHYKSLIGSPKLHMNRLFFTLTKMTFLEYETICLELKLPIPALPPLPNPAYLNEPK